MDFFSLPDEFTAGMQALLGPEFPEYIDTFSRPKACGLRVNTGKITPEEFQRLSGEKLEAVPWAANGFYYCPEWAAAKDPYHYAGLYYLQEPSAMAPAALLPVTPGEKVLDLCAAPGGKATELGAKLKGSGLLFANDASNSRAKALLKNLERFGIPNICVTSETPENLAHALPGFFDKILVDAPCSGEGMFRREPDMVKDWTRRGPEFYRPVQARILDQAVSMLKPGGYLMYSTCTFSLLENEEQISGFLSRFPDMELEALPVFPGFSEGVGLPGTLRLFPHKIKGEGHFLALLHKKDGDREDRPKEKRLKGSKNTAVKKASPPRLEGLMKFQKDLEVAFDPERLCMIEDRLYYLPESFPGQAKLRYLRTGLLLGECKSGRFEPSQALAMALRGDAFKRTICFSHDGQRAVRYLKGESILPGGHEEDGWNLVCVDGFPLGWARKTGNVIKNKYCPGWRFQ